MPSLISAVAALNGIRRHPLRTLRSSMTRSESVESCDSGLSLRPLAEDVAFFRGLLIGRWSERQESHRRME